MKVLVPDLALVGAGYWGKNLARNFLELGALKTLCDRSPQILASYTEEYASVCKTTSFEDVLSDPAITKLVISAPASAHFSLSKAALEHGKDVYVEKPLCLDVAEAETLVNLASEKKRILMVGHLLQYHPCIVEIQRLIATGELGKLHYITSNRLNLGKIRQEENALWSFAPHDISVILSLVGNRMPEVVTCTGESYLTPGVADTTLTTLKFSGSVRAHVYVSWLNPFKEQKLTVVASKGMIVFDDTKPWPEKLVIHRDYLTWASGSSPMPSKELGTFIDVAKGEPLRQECAHFLQCCADRSASKTDGHEGIRVLSVLKAASASLEADGKAVTPNSKSTSKAYFAHSTAVVDTEASIASGCKIWHFSHVMAGAKLGSNCSLGQNVVVSPGVTLGNNVKVQNNVSIYTGTTIEDDVFLGPSCVLTNVSNPRSQINRRNLYELTTIRKGATIGANATIVCGTTIGRYAFVAAGAVVTKSVPDYAFVAGVPGRQKGWMSRHGHRLRTPAGDGELTCPESGLRYAVAADGGLRCLDLGEDEALPPTQAVGATSYRELKTSAGKEP